MGTEEVAREVALPEALLVAEVGRLVTLELDSVPEPQSRSLNNVAVSRIEPFALLMNSCVK